MKRTVIKTFKIVTTIVVSILLLLGGATLLLNTKSVQDKMLKRATELLETKLETKVGIDSISVNLFAHEIRLYGIRVEDQQQRKMLELQRLGVDLSLSKLLQNEITVKKAEISGLDALLLKPSKEEPANYQFILDAFKKKDSAKDSQEEKTENADKFALDIDNVDLQDIHIRYNDNDIRLLQAKYHHSWLGKRQLKAEGLSADWISHSKKDSIVSNKASIGLLTATMDKQEKLVRIDNLHYKNDNHKPRKNSDKPKKGFFDAKHLDITANLQLTIDSLGKDTLVARLTKCTATDSVTGIDIRDFRTVIHANMEKVSLSDVTIQQKSTILNIDQGELTLPNEKEGRPLSYSTGTIRGKALLKDISKVFAPVLNQFSLPLNFSTRMNGNDSTIAFRDIHVTTDDKKLNLTATGDITHLKDKEELDIRFHISKMTANGDIKEEIINQFSVKKLMMKQLRNLGDISYTGEFAVLYKRVAFHGLLGTVAGPLDLLLTIDSKNHYVVGTTRTKGFGLGRVMDMKDVGRIIAKADFKIDISKSRTAVMRRQKGGKLPIGNVSATVEDCSYKKIHVRNLSATIRSDGAEATGDIMQRGMHRDLFCSFSFTNTDDMQKIKITKPGIKFHKASEEDKAAKAERKAQRKQEKQKKREEKAQSKKKKEAVAS